VLVAILSCALVVSRLTMKLISVTVFIDFSSPRSEVLGLRIINIYTSGSDGHGPGFNRGSGSGARGCGCEERVDAHARSEGPISYSYFVCVLCVCAARMVLQKKCQRLPRRVAE